MSYESRVYDKNHDDGFGPDPVVVLVVTGTHDVSRFVSLLNGGTPLVEQVGLAKKITRQVNRAKGGRLALSLLKQHGGPDLLEAVTAAEPLRSSRGLLEQARRELAKEKAESYRLREHGLKLLRERDQAKRERDGLSGERNKALESLRCGGCYTCTSPTWGEMQSFMIVCPTCGNKRCPHATFHGNACTGSNEPGQEGSNYSATSHRQAVVDLIRQRKTELDEARARIEEALALIDEWRTASLENGGPAYHLMADKIRSTLTDTEESNV